MKNHVFNSGDMPRGVRSSSRKIPLGTRGINTDWEVKPQGEKRGFTKRQQIVMESIDDFIANSYSGTLKLLTVSGIKSAHNGLVYGKVGKRRVQQFRVQRKVKVKCEEKVITVPIDGSWVYC